MITPGTKTNICGVSVIYVLSLWGEKKKKGGSLRKPSVWRRSVSCFWEGGWLLYVNTDGAWTPERLLHCLAFSSWSMFSYVCVMSSTFSQCIATTHNSSFLLFSFCSPLLLPSASLSSSAVPLLHYSPFYPRNTSMTWQLPPSGTIILVSDTPAVHTRAQICIQSAEKNPLKTHTVHAVHPPPFPLS